MRRTLEELRAEWGQLVADLRRKSPDLRRMGDEELMHLLRESNCHCPCHDDEAGS